MSASDVSPAAQAAPAAVPKRRRWLRRLFVLLLLLLLLLRLGLPWMVRPALNRALKPYGLEATIDDLDLGLLGGRLALRDVSVRERSPHATPAGRLADPAEEFLRLHLLSLDWDMTALLTGRVRAHELQLDGLDVRLERDATGIWNVQRYLDQAGAAGPQPEAESKPKVELPAEDGGPAVQPIELGLPLEITLLRAQRLELQVRDSASGATEALRFAFDLSINDLGSKTRSARVSANLSADRGLDRLHLDLRGTSAGPEADVAADFDLAGLDLKRFATWLAPLGLELEGAQPWSARGALKGQIRAAREDQSECRAELELAPLRLSAGGQSVAGLESLKIDVPALFGPRLEIRSVELGGLFARAGLDPAGRLEVGGLVLVPPTTAGVAQSAEPAKAPAADPDAAQKSVALGEFQLQGARFEFLDRSQPQPAEVAFLLNSLRINSLEFGGTSGPGPRFSPVSLEASAPGLWERLTLTGQLELAETLALDLTLALSGLQPLAAEPYLKALGWQSTYTAGSLDARLVGSFQPNRAGGFEAQMALEGLRLQDQAQPGAENPSGAPTEHLRLDRLALEGLAQSPAGALLVERLSLEGLVAGAQREADGTLRLLGLQGLLPEAATGPAVAAPVTSASQAAPALQPNPKATEPASAPARVQIKAVDFSGIELAFEDRASPGNPRLATAPLSLTARDIGLFGGEASTGQLELELGLRGLFERLNLSAQLSPGAVPEALAVAGQFALIGLDYQVLEPMLKEAGIARFGDPAQAAGSFEFQATPVDGAFEVAAQLNQWKFSSGPVEWANLDALQWQAARFGPAGNQLGRVRLSGLTLQAERDAAGGLLAFGLRLEPKAQPAASPAGTAATPVAPAPASPNSGAAGTQPAQSAPASAASALSLESLELAAVEVRWRDAALADPLDLGLRLDGAFSGYSNQITAAPANFDVQLGLNPTAGLIRLSGTLAASPVALDLAALLEGSAMDFGPLAPYFPPGMTSEFSAGGLVAKLAAQIRSEAEGQRFGLEVSDFVLTPVGTGPAAMAFERLSLDGAMGNNPNTPSYTLGLDWRGLELRARRSPEGTLHLLGLALAPNTTTSPETTSAAAPSAEVGSGAEAPGVPPAISPAELEAQVANSEAPASTTNQVQVDAPLPISNSAPLVAAARRVIPRVELQRFEFDLARCEFLDESAVDAVPLLANLSLLTPGPLLLLDPEPERIQPVALELRGGLEPGLRQLEVQVTSEPFDLDPWAELRLAFEGLNAPELARLVPSAFEGVDPTALADANFSLNLRSEIDLPRREVLDFNLQAGLSANVTAENLALRGVTDGPPLIGLEKLAIEGLRYLPATGALDVRSVELSKPAGRIKIKPEGIELAGLTFLSQPAEAAPTEQKKEPEGASPEAPAVADGSTAGTPTVATASAPGAEVSIGQLLISGLDFELEDQTGERPVLLPFNQLEVDVRGLSTRALKEPLPVRFNLFLGAGQVELRKRERASSLLAGVVGAAGRAVAGGTDEVQYEMRNLMQEISAVGRLTLAPKPEGLVRFDIAGLELPAFYGLAKRSGVEIDDGVLDLKLRAELQGEQGLELETRTVFTDLSLSEPADGPIARYLKLPAPLDSVVYLLKNQNGELSLPLSVDVPADGLGGAAIAGAAVTTLGTVIANAVASSPLRVTGALTGLLGIGGGAEEPELLAAQDVGFAAGWGELTSEGRAELATLAASLRKDKQLRAVLTHEFGSADWARAAALANPPRAEAEALAHQLRQRRDVLEQRREAAAADARGAVLLGTDEAVAQARALLLELDLERQAAEAALDRLYALLRPGAESRAEARTREAALAVAGSRLDAIYAELLSLGVPNPAERLEFRPPRSNSDSGGEQGRVHIELRRVK